MSLDHTENFMRGKVSAKGWPKLTIRGNSLYLNYKKENGIGQRLRNIYKNGPAKISETVQLGVPG